MTATSGPTFVKPESSPRKSLRTLGALLALSSPISGFVPFAVLATIIGEQKLENSDGLTGLGWAAMAVPALLGLALIAWSFVDAPRPSRAGVQIGLAALGIALAGTGVASLIDSGPSDASIGGGLLIITSIVIAVGLTVEAIAHKAK